MYNKISFFWHFIWRQTLPDDMFFVVHSISFHRFLYWHIYALIRHSRVTLGSHSGVLAQQRSG
jgi:hypothetical protein